MRLRDFLEQHQVKVRFILAGGLNTVIGLSVFPLLYLLMEKYKVHYMVVLCISQVIGVLFAYCTSKFLVFRTKGNYLAEFTKFVTFHLSYFVANLVALPLMVSGLALNPIVAQSIFAIAVIVSSYFWHSRITFSAE